jgi:hypothetical protein
MGSSMQSAQPSSSSSGEVLNEVDLTRYDLLNIPPEGNFRLPGLEQIRVSRTGLEGGCERCLQSGDDLLLGISQSQKYIQTQNLSHRTPHGYTSGFGPPFRGFEAI